MKKTGGRILKTIIIIVLIMALSVVDVINIGVQCISYAIGNLKTTNAKNVLFMATFLDQSGNETQYVESNMEDENVKLRLAIKVEKEGYFTGKIQINNSNFKLKNDTSSEYINTIEDNCVNLNQINAGQEVVLDIGITPIKDDNYQLDFLNKISDIQILGTYTLGENSTKEIDTVQNVQLKLLSGTSNDNVVNNVEVVTNKIYEVNGENKRIVQLEVLSNLAENSYPIKTTTIEADVLESTENIEVYNRGTYATNNNNAEIETKWNQGDSKVETKITNFEQDGTVQWNKNGKDKMIVTYILPEDANVLNSTIELKNKIELYDENDTVLETSTNVVLDEEKDGAIDYKIQSQDELYKGNLYYGEETNLETTSVIDIRVKGISNDIEIQDGDYKYLGENLENDANTKYYSTIINKAQALKVLGESGKIEIKSNDGTEIETLNKEILEQKDEENIEISYEGQKSVVIAIMNAENEGELVIKNL